MPESAKIVGLDLELPEDFSRDKWLEHLSSVYTIEFSLLTISGSIAAAATPILLGFVNQIPSRVSDQALAILPLAPLIVLLFYAYVFFNGRLVGKYARELERAIGSNAPMKYPALSRLNGALYGGESRKLMPLRFVFVLLALSIFLVTTATMYLLIVRIQSTALQSVAFTIYGLILAMLLYSFISGASHSIWEELKSAIVSREELKRYQRYMSGMSWSRYIAFALFPRVLSLGKASDAIWLLPIIAFLWGDFSNIALGRGLAGLAVFEIVLYQTRYFMNGMREDASIVPRLPADRRNDSSSPFTSGQRLTSPLLTALRLLAFVYLANLWKIFSLSEALAVVASFLVAVYLYEIPREYWRSRYRSIVLESGGEEGFLARRAEALAGSSIFRITGWVLFVAVGMGYALRATVLVFLFAPDLLASWPGIALVLSVWAGGSAQVSAGWAVELQGALHKDRGVDDGVIHAAAVAKPQLLWAGRRLKGTVGDPVRMAVFPSDETREDEVIEDWDARQDSRAPWVIGLVFASVIAVSISLVGVEFANRVVGVVSVLATLSLLLYASSIRSNWSLTMTRTVLLVFGLGFISGLLTSVILSLGIALAATWPLIRVKTAQSARLKDLIEAAARIMRDVGGTGRLIGHAVVVLAEYLFGYSVVHSLDERFRSRRSGWW